MSITKAFKIYALWLSLAIIAIAILFWSQPMIGGSLLLTFFSLLFVVLGAPIQIILAWKYPNKSMFSQFLYSCTVILFIILIVASTGKFNVT